MYQFHICNHSINTTAIFEFWKTLKIFKFNMNPYDPCVDNLLVNLLQKSILFCVYDFKLIQNDPRLDDCFIGVLCEKCQSIFEDGSGMMQVNRVNFHKFLGMALDYTTVGQVKTTMLYYIDKVIYAFDKVYPIGGGT